MFKQGYSIEAHLQSRLTKLLLLLAILLLVPLHLSVRSFVDGIIEQRLGHDAETIITALSLDPNSQWQLQQERISSIYQRVQSGHYFKLQSEQFQALSRSLWDRELNVSSVAPGVVDIAVVINDDQRWMILTQGFKKSDVTFTLAVAEDVTELYHNQWLLELLLFLIMIVVFGFVVWLQRRMVKSGFASLEPVQQAIEAGDISSSIQFPDQLPKEIAPLAGALNRLLTRSAAQIERSRTGLGNLAHELKRPIQKLRWLASELESNENSERAFALSEEFQHLMDRELRRARISGTPTPGKLFAPDSDLTPMVELFKRIYPSKELHLKQLPRSELPYDRDDMLELIGNLLDNALRYATTKAELSITYSSENRSWILSIEDDGKGVSQENRSLLSERGIRLDEDSPVTGSGLGIAISKAVLESYSGNLIFSDASLGGLGVKVELPI
jgi:signal transduction histidine kinase